MDNFFCKHLMKPLFFKLPKTENTPLRVQVDALPYFYDKLHFHPEIQITLVLKGKGTYFIGDKIERFEEGQLFVLGGNLPHVFKSDREYFEDKNLSVEAISLFFMSDIFGKGFWEFEETHQLEDVFADSGKGLVLEGESFSNYFEKIAGAEGFEKFVLFFQILQEILMHEDRKVISSMAFTSPQRDIENERINSVFDFVINNYKEDITLKIIAEVASLTPNAFCKFFKVRTRKTFFEFLNEVRIGNACKLLQTDHLSISEVAFESGFNNLSNFNRQFQKRMNMTPKKYQGFISQ
jgi:AraC-like DNA-binding protein